MFIEYSILHGNNRFFFSFIMATHVGLYCVDHHMTYESLLFVLI